MKNLSLKCEITFRHEQLCFVHRAITLDEEIIAQQLRLYFAHALINFAVAASSSFRVFTFFHLRDIYASSNEIGVNTADVKLAKRGRAASAKILRGTDLKENALVLIIYCLNATLIT